MNLIEVFRDMPEYVLIKMSNLFPTYIPGSDVDIVCKDIECVYRHLLRWCGMPDNTTKKSDNHFHVDYGKGPNLRFDLYGEYISKEFTTKLFENKAMWGDVITIPSQPYDRMIKCYEYIHNGKDKYVDFVIYKALLDEYTD